MGQDRLPGIGKGRKRIGRNRRSFDRFARFVRDEIPNGSDPLVEDELQTLRDLSDELDRMEQDPEHSPHTFAMVARTYADLRRETAARIASRPGAVTLADVIATVRDGAGQ